MSSHGNREHRQYQAQAADGPIERAHRSDALLETHRAGHHRFGNAIDLGQFVEVDVSGR
jgi:hypothetical protein